MLDCSPTRSPSTTSSSPTGSTSSSRPALYTMTPRMSAERRWSDASPATPTRPRRSVNLDTAPGPPHRADRGLPAAADRGDRAGARRQGVPGPGHRPRVPSSSRVSIPAPGTPGQQPRGLPRRVALYEVPIDITADELLHLHADSSGRRTRGDLVVQARKKGVDFYDALTIASLVEREAKVDAIAPHRRRLLEPPRSQAQRCHRPA